MRKIPISGGPHTGKTTLFKALHAEYPDAYFVPEPAELVIAEELKKEERSQRYKGSFPWSNYPAFARLAVNKSLELEAGIPKDVDLAFQDRSLVDNIGYGRLNDYEELFTEIHSHIRLAHYALAFFCEPVGKYTQTTIRRETPDQAQRTHEHLKAAYSEVSFAVINLPTIPIEETEKRLAIVRDTLAQL